MAFFRSLERLGRQIFINFSPNLHIRIFALDILCSVSFGLYSSLRNDIGQKFSFNFLKINSETDLFPVFLCLQFHYNGVGVIAVLSTGGTMNEEIYLIHPPQFIISFRFVRGLDFLWPYTKHGKFISYRQTCILGLFAPKFL